MKHHCACLPLLLGGECIYPAVAVAAATLSSADIGALASSAFHRGWESSAPPRDPPGPQLQMRRATAWSDLLASRLLQNVDSHYWKAQRVM